MKLLRLSIPCLALLYFLGCTPEAGPIIPSTTVETKEVNNSIANTVILQQVFEVDIKVASLNGAVGNFISNPTVGTLDSARNKWREAHQWWAESQAMLVGPGVNSNLSVLMDSYPVDVTDIKKVLAFQIINEDLILSFGGSLKGFHALEYLLFGIDGSKNVSDFTGNEFTYMGVVARELERLTQSLRYSWDPARENYVGQFTNTGQNGGAYATDVDALRELIDAMIFICDDLAERKIGKPLDLLADSLQESRFSSNSTNDYRSNILGVRYMYQGGREPTSLGISALVYYRSGTALTDKVSTELTNAINAIDSLFPTFSSSLAASPSDVSNARQAVRALKTTLESQVRPILLQ